MVVAGPLPLTFASWIERAPDPTTNVLGAIIGDSINDGDLFGVNGATSTWKSVQSPQAINIQVRLGEEVACCKSI